MTTLLRKLHLELYRAEIGSAFLLPIANHGISCGFPSPAEDYMEQAIDLNQVLIKDREATFFGRVKGDSMADANIADGDVLVIDRAVQAKNGDIVLGMLNGEFTVKRLQKRSGQVTLHPANPKYPPIPVTPDMDFAVWGVVTYVSHKTR